MGRLLDVLADGMDRDSALFTRAETWPGGLGPSEASLPLRLASGLHALVLTGRDRDLVAAYPPNAPGDPAFAAAVLGALARHERFLLDWIDRPPQTNEVRRAAPLIAAAQLVAARFGLPLRVSELGASAGLNLMFDRFALVAGNRRCGPGEAALTLEPDWDGPAPAPAPLRVAGRRGVDLTPLDPRDPDDVIRLHAYLWPDQPERRDLTRRAVAAFDARVDRGDAIDWLAGRLGSPLPGHVHLIYHTVAWQYFPKKSQTRGRRLIESAGAGATADTPLAWFAMEADERGPGAALSLRLWPGGETLDLGRADFHGRWVRWSAP